MAEKREAPLKKLIETVDEHIDWLRLLAKQPRAKNFKPSIEAHIEILWQARNDMVGFITMLSYK